MALPPVNHRGTTLMLTVIPRAAWLAALLLAANANVEARVVRIVVDEARPLAAEQSGGVAFEQVAGRAFGELDPQAAANAIVNDIQLVREPDGKVRYVATFVLTKPVDLG